jgi:streptogramin lyase
MKAAGMVAVATLAFLATVPAAGKQSPLTVKLATRPAGLVVGQAWAATLMVRRGRRPVGLRVSLVARNAALTRRFPARRSGPGRYRAVVSLPSAGSWTFVARIGKRSFLLGRVTVRERRITLLGPTGIARGPSGAIVVADRSSGRILRFDPAARRLSVLSDDVTQPTGLDVDAAGNVWVADDAPSRVVRIDPAGDARTMAEIPNPLDVAVCPSGDVFVVGRDSRVRRIDGDGTVSVYAGTGAVGHGGDDGPAAAATLAASHGVVCDAAGNVLLADGYRVRRIDHATGIITTIAGTGQAGFAGDGGPATAGQITAIRLEPVPDGSIYVADLENSRVRRISADGLLSTVAGTGRVEDLEPYDLVLAPDGSLLVVEYHTPRIRRVDPATGAVETLVGPR